MAKLQELYMRDLDQSKAVTVHDSIQQSNLLQLATPEMLAMSQPPASFPVPQVAKTAAIVPALHEIETLRRERASLKEQVKRRSLTLWLMCAENSRDCMSNVTDIHLHSTWEESTSSCILIALLSTQPLP